MLLEMHHIYLQPESYYQLMLRYVDHYNDLEHSQILLLYPTTKYIIFLWKNDSLLFYLFQV